MRRTRFTVLLTSAFALSSPAFAADAGTYRPGNTYNSITATTADICEMQCSGDAQCRSWNFVRIENMSEGVCEFNDNISTPQPSAISVSGNNVSRARSSRVSHGGTNTVRVGAPSVTQAAARIVPSQVTPTRRVGQPPAPSNSQLAGLSLMQQQRMNSQARVQGQMQPRQAAPRQLQATQTRINPRQFKHSLEDGRAAQVANAPRPTAPSQMAVAPVAPTFGAPRLQRRLMQQRQGSAQTQASRATAPIQAPQTYPSVAPATPAREFASAGSGLASPPGVAPLSAPPGVPPLQSSGQGQAPSAYMSPSMAGAPPAPRRVAIPSELSPRPMGSGDQLFGSLFDDVKVPRPIDPQLAADPDAPIPTVSSVPVAPVQTAPLPPVR